MIRLKKGISARYWEALSLALIGEMFPMGPEICGIVLSVRYHEDVISIWNRNQVVADCALDKAMRESLLELVGLPRNCVIEYKPHNTATQVTDKSDKQE
jgi:translation initiation factor 4E